MAEKIVLFVLLLFSAADIRTKKLPVAGLAAAGGAAVVYHMAAGSFSVSLLVGLLPGLLVLLLSYLTKESIGAGDGLLLCAFGLFAGFAETVVVFGMALLLTAVTSMVLLTLRRAGRKTELPFVPFLCGGYLVCLLW